MYSSEYSFNQNRGHKSSSNVLNIKKNSLFFTFHLLFENQILSILHLPISHQLNGSMDFHIHLTFRLYIYEKQKCLYFR